MLTPDERRIIEALGHCFTAFQRLPVLHPADAYDMEHAIHAAQNIVLSRSGFRELHKDPPKS